MLTFTKYQRLLAATGTLLLPGVACATCWEEASHQYRVPVTMLKAIARVESNMNPEARGINPNGTYDIGLMQINSSWLQTLKTYKLNEKSLKDPCLNLKVGAWILSRNVHQYGWNWEAIGAYNVGCQKLTKTECSKRRFVYAKKVHNALSSSEIQSTRTQPKTTQAAPKRKGLVVFSFGEQAAQVEKSTPHG